MLLSLPFVFQAFTNSYVDLGRASTSHVATFETPNILRTLFLAPDEEERRGAKEEAGDAACVLAGRGSGANACGMCTAILQKMNRKSLKKGLSLQGYSGPCMVSVEEDVGGRAPQFLTT